MTIRRETRRERLVTLIKALAHQYSGAGVQVMEYEALDLVDKLLPLPRLTFWQWSKRRWRMMKEQ